MAFWNRRKKGPPDENPEAKKVGFIRRQWRKLRAVDWKNPVNRWKLLFVLLIVCIGGLGFVGGAIAFTNSPSFCKACHEMAPEHVTFEKSAHNQITCVQCHIAPGNVEMVLHKIGSLKEVYYHITGVPDPIVQTVAVLDENCEQCHSKNRLVTATGDLIVNHEGHIKEGIPCVVCHSGVAHAKVVERGINGSETYDKWTMENSDKLMSSKYMNPNMGTCIDCHDQVNQGKKPWKDYSYQIPENPHAEGHGDKKEGNEAEAATLSASEEEQKSKEATQEIILQAIGKQKTDVKLSMECFTCHQEINTPQNHDIAEWNQNHGGYAFQELDKCMNCHQDEKWIKHFEKQDIEQLLKTSTDKEKYTANMIQVKDQSRQNHFCSTCHANRPPGHVDSDTWLTAHAPKAQTNEEKANCYVCHDREKPDENATDIKAPTDVYCQFCHRTGFKGEKL
ncbi:cytochrome c3 family protein [Neobacillus sp. LXY-4]|uniref:cytochrome c3 family protein n=1 Tax=Neobacillus sp. LXY-4 TaxID=3379826 RepID=UPI003EDED195